MKIEACAVALATIVLTGCTNRGNPTVCTSIQEPPSATSVEDSLASQQDPEWQRVRAEACVHRQSYRLASSSDPAETVAKAVVVHCESPIDGAARVSAHTEIDPAADDIVTPEELNALAGRIAEITANFEKYALSKVVEGRAGNCKP